MHAETAQKFEALEGLAAKLRALFTAANYEPVAPAILQPADILLDCLGEALRARTYVFTDLDGHELCLRPDLTVPTARLYLERHPILHEEARYCYNGPTFRYTPANGNKTRPREFRQTGLELYASSDKLAAETEVFRLTLEAVEQAGLTDYKIRIGDLEMFTAVLAAIEIPERWRSRLRHHFWRPDAFHKLLHELADGSEGKSRRRGDWPTLDPENPGKAQKIVADYLADKKIPLIGARALEEITERMLEFELDAREKPLSQEHVQLIDDYLDINAPPRAAMARLGDLADSAQINIKKAIKRFEKRLDLFKDKGIDLKNSEFGAEFGRDFEYYTGFVFQIEVEDMPETGPIAGGGRYDRLLGKLGSEEAIPAMGCAIHTERLLTVVEGDLS